MVFWGVNVIFRCQIYFKELEVNLDTPVEELFDKFDSLMFEIDRLSIKIIK